MQSIQTRLSIGLIFSLIIAFSALWLLVSINIRYVAEEYISSRLVHDAETLLSNIDFDQDSNLVIDQSRVDLVYQLILAVVVITLWRKKQTTPGKAIFRLKIVDLRDGSRPSLPRLVVRFFGYLVAMVPIPLPLVTLV